MWVLVTGLTARGLFTCYHESRKQSGWWLLVIERRAGLACTLPVATAAFGRLPWIHRCSKDYPVMSDSG